MSGKISRRQFVGAAAGAAAATYLGGVQQALAKKPKPGHDDGHGHGKPDHQGKRTVPPHMLGVQHFSVRDATARLSIAASARLGVAPTMGRLGGPDYPHDPNDLGPLVPLPGGYAEVFEYLASVDVMGFEFFQSTQSALEFDPPRQPTAAEIRKYLDDAGLDAMGTHQFGPQNLNPQTMELFPADPSASRRSGATSTSAKTSMTHAASRNRCSTPATAASRPTSPSSAGPTRWRRRSAHWATSATPFTRGPSRKKSSPRA